MSGYIAIRGDDIQSKAITDQWPIGVFRNIERTAIKWVDVIIKIANRRWVIQAQDRGVQLNILIWILLKTLFRLCVFYLYNTPKISLFIQNIVSLPKQLSKSYTEFDSDLQSGIDTFLLLAPELTIVQTLQSDNQKKNADLVGLKISMLGSKYIRLLLALGNITL